MNPPIGWSVAPSDEHTALQAELLAAEKVSQFNAYTNRQNLRDRLSMIITIDRADTKRSISSHTSLNS
jgi:hypothetical protein